MRRSRSAQRWRREHFSGPRERVGYWVQALALALAAAILITGCSGDSLLTAYLEANKSQLQRPAGPTSSPVEFVVEPGTPARVIAANLKSARLIADARLFEAYLRVNGLSNRLEAGTYQLKPSMTPIEIAEALQHSRAKSVSLTIPEGWRLEQTADYVAASGPVNGNDYRELAAKGEVSGLPGIPADAYAFLEARPAGVSLEGYLFPDTYELPAEGATASDLIQRQLTRFAERVLPEYAKATTEGQTLLTLHQVLTLASIVDREAVLPEERPIIAGVYLNRLAQGMKLEADPTVQYALGFQPESEQWWKTPMSLEEYGQVDSLFNTYLHEGLPPGPIASPGLDAIKAVLYPTKHDYLFFVARPGGSGEHVFSKTYEEHLENVRHYRQG